MICKSEKSDYEVEFSCVLLIRNVSSEAEAEEKAKEIFDPRNMDPDDFCVYVSGV